MKIVILSRNPDLAVKGNVKNGLLLFADQSREELIEVLSGALMHALSGALGPDNGGV